MLIGTSISPPPPPPPPLPPPPPPPRRSSERRGQRWAAKALEVETHFPVPWRARIALALMASTSSFSKRRMTYVGKRVGGWVDKDAVDRVSRWVGRWVGGRVREKTNRRTSTYPIHPPTYPLTVSHRTWFQAKLHIIFVLPHPLNILNLLGGGVFSSSSGPSSRRTPRAIRAGWMGKPAPALACMGGWVGGWLIWVFLILS